MTAVDQETHVARVLSDEERDVVAKANALVVQAYAMLDAVFTARMPVGRVQWIHMSRVQANDYNPNAVAFHEMKLLHTSITEDGYCVEQSTPILCADLTWRAAGTLQPGTEIIAFDEQPQQGSRRRRFRTATVTANGLREEPLWRVTTDKGEILCTADHPWLAQPQYGDASKRTTRWVNASDLRPGTRVSRPFEPWKTDDTRSAGWLAGFLDADGTMAVNVNKSGRSVFRLSGYQRPSLTADRMIEEITARAEAKVFTVTRSAHEKWSDMVMCRVDRLGEIMRLLGSVRPERLIESGGRFWEGYETSTPNSWVEVRSVELADEKGTVATLSTSTGTYIADGYLHHNTQPVVAIWDPTAQGGEGRYIIVDGYHRYTVMSKYPDVADSTGGYLPVVVLDKDIADRIAATVRHNRARGKHSVQGMGSLIFQMLAAGESDETICNKIGLEAEELARLKHITGYSKLYEEAKYSPVVLTKTQLDAKAAYKREHPDETVPRF